MSSPSRKEKPVGEGATRSRSDIKSTSGAGATSVTKASKPVRGLYIQSPGRYRRRGAFDSKKCEFRVKNVARATRDAPTAWVVATATSEACIGSTTEGENKILGSAAPPAGAGAVASSQAAAPSAASVSEGAVASPAVALISGAAHSSAVRSLTPVKVSTAVAWDAADGEEIDGEGRAAEAWLSNPGGTSSGAVEAGAAAGAPTLPASPRGKTDEGMSSGVGSNAPKCRACQLKSANLQVVRTWRRRSRS